MAHVFGLPLLIAESSATKLDNGPFLVSDLSHGIADSEPHGHVMIGLNIQHQPLTMVQRVQ